MSKPVASILVVDDEADILAIARLLLVKAGYEVDCVERGDEAIKRMDSRGYDLVITDMLMPEMDGVELITSVRRMNPDQRILAMSGGGHAPRENYLQIASMYGVNGVLPKPFNRDQLLEAISACASVQDPGESS
jgi:CheY-like chemotaxis protein